MSAGVLSTVGTSVEAPASTVLAACDGLDKLTSHELASRNGVEVDPLDERARSSLTGVRDAVVEAVRHATTTASAWLMLDDPAPDEPSTVEPDHGDGPATDCDGSCSCASCSVLSSLLTMAGTYVTCDVAALSGDETASVAAPALLSRALNAYRMTLELAGATDAGALTGRYADALRSLVCALHHEAADPWSVELVEDRATAAGVAYDYAWRAVAAVGARLDLDDEAPDLRLRDGGPGTSSSPRQLGARKVGHGHSSCDN